MSIKNYLISRTQVLRSIVFLVTLTTVGCTWQVQDGPPPDQEIDWDSIPDAEPRVEPISRHGNPKSYQIGSKRYFVKSEATGFEQTGVASWYGTKFHGKRTASGEVYDMYQMTAAHKTLPLPSYVEVNNLDNGRTVVVKVNDRGPFAHNRIIDMSYAAAKKLQMTKNGTARVKIRALAVPDSAALSDEIFYLQVGAFSDRRNADNLMDKLSASAISPLNVTQAIRPDKSIFQVRVGPLLSEQHVEQVKAQLQSLGITESFLIVK